MDKLIEYGMWPAAIVIIALTGLLLFRNSLKKIPDAKPADPWGNARSTDAPKATAKTPAAKKSPTKTGNTAN